MLRMEVVGLRELQRALKSTSDETPRAIQNAHKAVAQIVVTVARANAGGTTLAERIQAVGTVKAAVVRFLGHKPKGKTKSTDALLQEFGGRAPLFGDRQHWHEVKARNKTGYYVYPAIRDTRDEVIARYLVELDKAIRAHWSR